MRNATIKRETNETKVELCLNVDGTGKYKIATGIGFFDHMMCLFARHGLFDLDLTVKGDLQVDEHHTIEDTGISLGEAFAKAAGNKENICRYATQIVPMDEALASASVDFSGRACLVYDVSCPDEVVGGISSQVFEEFFRAFTVSAKITLHVKAEYGNNTHHIIEAVFKAVARAVRFALEPDSRASGIPSTKGVL